MSGVSLLVVTSCDHGLDHYHTSHHSVNVSSWQGFCQVGEDSPPRLEANLSLDVFFMEAPFTSSKPVESSIASGRQGGANDTKAPGVRLCLLDLFYDLI